MDKREENLRDAMKDDTAFDHVPLRVMHDHVNPDGTEKAVKRYDRERLIALLSWWSGWCTDHDHVEPELAKLGGLLLDAKHRIALDRPPVLLSALPTKESR